MSEDNNDEDSEEELDLQGDEEGKDSSTDQRKKKLTLGRSFILGENGQLQKVIRKRKRKSQDQLKILMREFDKNPNWSKETLLEVSRKTGLSEAQVYKWGWD